MESVAHVDPALLVSIDGMSHSRKDFHDRKGWAPEGVSAVKYEISISGKSFAVHAAMCPFGFIAYEIFEGTVTQFEVNNFLRQRLSPLLPPGSFGLIDNTTNQKTALVYDTLEKILDGEFVHIRQSLIRLKEDSP